MMEEFYKRTKDLEWKRSRTLPDWAERIFSGSMIAASNVNDVEELEQIKTVVLANLAYYLSNVGVTNGQSTDTTVTQNYYCENQRSNPHTPKVMASLGLDEEDVRVFIQDCLFPKIGGQ